MRTFIAIELPREIRESLAHLQEELKSSGADVKWVKPDNIHLTLKFLGEIDDKKAGEVSKIIEDIGKGKRAFQARISSIGAFPNMNSPRVIWVGIDKGDNETKEIAKGVEEKIAKIGIPKENRDFSSHISIGRTRSALNRERLAKELKTAANNLEKNNLEFSITKIALFKSTLTPNGPIYEALKETSLTSA